MSTTPLQTAVAAAALMNGGKLIPPTFLPRSREEADRVAVQVVKPKTSAEMRYLYRLNVEKGSGKRAEVPGYRVGGKTGTAEKVVNGRYSADKRFNAFLAAFPMDDPQYVVLASSTSRSRRSRAWAPPPARTPRRSSPTSSAAPPPFLASSREFGHEGEATLVSSQ